MNLYPTDQEARQQILDIGRRMYERRYVSSNDGNITVRTGENRVWVTPTGVSKGFMAEQMLICTDLSGGILEGTAKPSSEIAMHLRVYRENPQVRAVVHAHPPVSTAFAVRREGLETPYLAELVAGLGQVPCTDAFAMLSTEEVPESVVPYLPDHNALLLANHGALTWGSGLWEAFDRMEVVEHTAKIFLNLHLLGGGVPLTAEEVARLLSLRGMYQTLREVRRPK